jgi:predicted esterase
MARKIWIVLFVAVALAAGHSGTWSGLEFCEADGPIGQRQAKKRGESVRIPPPTWPAPATALNLDESKLALLHRLVRERAAALKPQDLARLPDESKALRPLRASGRSAVAETTEPPVTRPNQDNRALARERSTSADLFRWFPREPEPESYRLKRDGYHSDVSVGAAGRLDWVFTVDTNSLDKEPARRLEGYDSTQQSYELFVPPGYKPDHAYPLILHIDPGGRSNGWRVWRTVCQRRGVFFAGPHNVGNEGGVERPVRRRIVLDVLDDVRHRYFIDPDRTYITGISGGGNTAARIAYALPELFGGLAAIVGTWGMRPEHWLRQRAAERLSIAVLTGERDFNRNELELEYFPFIEEHTVRSMLRVYPGIGHQPPKPAQLEEVFQWLEAGLPARRQSAQRFPAGRLARPATADEWSSALLVEVGDRLQTPDGLAMAIFLLEGVTERWPGTPAARFSQELLREFDAHSSVPSKDILNSEKLRFAYLQASCHDSSYAAGPPAGYPIPWAGRTRIAIECWNDVLRQAPSGSDVGRKAQTRLDTLRKESN